MVARGKVYLYFQRNRNTPEATKAIRLPDEPGSADFWTAYERLAATERPATAKVVAKSVADLVMQFRGDLAAGLRPSPEWEALADSTKVNYSIYLDRMAEAWGAKAARIIHASDALEARDAMSATPYAANSFLAVGRVLFKWGIPRRFSDNNPFADVSSLDVGDEGHIPWPRWAWDYVIANAPEDIGRFVFCALHTGQRESDVVRIGPADREGQGIWVKPKKTGKKRGRIWIPLTSAAASELDRMARDPVRFVNPRFKAPTIVPTGDTYVFSPRAKPYNPDSFRSRWIRWLDSPDGERLKEQWVAYCRLLAERAGEAFDPEDAKQPALHGLRGSAVAVRRMAGANAQQISNDIGMSAPMVARYTRFMDQKMAAESNITLLEEADRRQSSSWPPERGG